MSNLLTPVDTSMLEAVTGGTTIVPRTTTSDDQLLQALAGISSTVHNLGCNSQRGGLSSMEYLMLGLLMSRGQVNVFVRRPFW